MNQVFQDVDSYIWIATQDGLNKYDGYDFQIFRPDLEDSFSISDNFIIQIVEDDFERLWLSTREGINVFDKRTGHFHKLNDPNNYPQVWHLQKHRDWMYWARFNGEVYEIVRMNHQHQFTSAHIEIDELTEFLTLTNKQFQQLIINDSGSYLIFEDYISKVGCPDTINLQRPYISTLVSNPLVFKDSLMVVPFQGGIVGINTLQMKQFLDIREHATFSTCQKTREEVYVSTSRGIYTLNLNTFKYEKVSTIPIDLSNTLVQDIYKDSRGTYWISTANKGMMIHDRRWENFQYIRTENSIVWDATDNEEIFLLGTQDGVVIQSKKDLSEHRRLLKNHKVTAVFIDNQNIIWAGTSEGLIFHSKPNETSFSPFPYVSPDRNSISEFFHDENGNLWIGSHSDVAMIDQDRRVISMEEKTGKYFYVLDMYEDRHGNLWIGSSNGLGYFTSENNFRLIPFIKSDPKSINFNFASAIQEDSQGTIWVATYGGGISRLNSDSTFTHFTTRDGLSNNVIHDMIIDNRDRLWMVSNEGLSIFDISSSTFVNLNKSNGLLSHNFALNGGNKLSDGQLSFGTVDGLLHFFSDSISWNDTSPQIHFEKFLINYKEIKNQSIDTIDELNLFAEDRVFSMEIVSPNFIDPKDLTYEYKLEGFDDEWVVSDKPELRITYSSLPYKNFILRVRNRSRNNRFAGSERTLSINVLPPFWLKWWFITAAIVCLGAMITGMIYYLSRRKLKIKLDELETKAKIQQERERISRDLHDSVGTHFAYIISRLDYLYLGWGKKEIGDTKDYLIKITDFARSGMKMLRETIWALNEEHVSSNSLKLKIDDYLKLCFTGLASHYKFSFQSLEEKVNAEVALNSFRIIQEGVSNAIKHSQARNISIRLSLDGEQILLDIEDDGKGFEMQEEQLTSEHYGLKNIRRRAEELNCSLNVVSDSSGTRIAIQSKNNP
ncbi:MAG: hypothetical protein JXR10_15785 [Cyclobacteriaceae bacterium]